MNNSISIGYVLKEFPKLSETFILNEILELERQGVHVKIFSLRDPFNSNPLQMKHGSLKNLQAKVFYLPTKMIFRTFRIKEGDYKTGSFSEHTWRDEMRNCTEDYLLYLQALMIASICNSSKVEHLHAHFGTASTVAMMAADMANISFSFTTHAKDIYKNDVDHNHLELKIKKSRFIITVSDYNKSFLDKKFKTCDNKIIRLYNGIDLNKFKKENERISDNTILSVGRLEKKKGFKYLIESCNALKNKEIDFKCLIVGEGQERKNLELLIKEYGLSRQVKLLGSKTQEEITELLNNSRVFVLPSIIDEFGDRDVLPTVLIEAMAMRVPVISTSISAIPEIIENNKSGILIKQKDPDKLAVCLQRLLSNEQLQKKYSENGRKRVKRLFDIEKNIPKLARLFERYTIKRKKRIAV